MSYTAMIPLRDITRNPNQPRRDPDPTAAAELTQSVKEYGVLTPITVRANGSGFMILAGHRRYYAADAAGLEEIPAQVIETAGETHNLAVALIENIQREDLPPIEEAAGLAALWDRLKEKDPDVSLQELARTVNLAYDRVRGMIKMLDLDPQILDLIRRGDLTYNFRVVDALYKLPEETRVAFAQKAAREGLSGHGVKRAVDRYLQYAKSNAGKSPGRYPDYKPAINPDGDLVDPETGEIVETAKEIIEEAQRPPTGKLPEGPKIPNVLKAAYGDGRAKVNADPQGMIKRTAVKACKACAFYGEAFDRSNPDAVCVECPLTRFLVSYHEQNAANVTP